MQMQQRFCNSVDLYSDIHVNNIMMEPTPLISHIPHPTHYTKSYDFKHYIRKRTRTSYPTRYFYIDFGLSYRLPPEDPSPRIHVAIGGDKTVPEYKDPHGLHDPYKIDVYCLGNIIQEHFMDVSSGLLWWPLVLLTASIAVTEDAEFRVPEAGSG